VRTVLLLRVYLLPGSHRVCVLLVGHRQVGSLHSDAVHVVVHIEYLLLLSIQTSTVRTIALVHDGQPHRARNEYV
jgi:hypothetical protein